VISTASQSVAGTATAGAASVGGAGGSLFQIARYDTVRLYIAVPQAYAQGVRPGLDAAVSVREIGERAFHGRVARTARAFDAATRTLLTEVDVVNPDGALLPGMYATTSLKFDRSFAPVVLPAAALIVRTHGAQAAVVGGDSVIQLRHLEIGRDLGASLEVDSGLADGDMVVMNASDDLRNGQRVRPQPEPQAGAAGGQSGGGLPENPPAATDSSSGRKGSKRGADSANTNARANDSTPAKTQIPLGPPKRPR
jgi:RND family efflux transporter MFP subunit